MPANLIKLENLDKLRIVTYPDPILSRVAEPVREITPEIRGLVERMANLMADSEGIGLAAPQVGVSLRVIVVNVTGKRQDVEVYINPELSNFLGSSEMEEGCLSIPGVRAKVRRAAACTMKALDINGNELVIDAVNLMATVFQHETDHLNGILFIERLNTISRLACRRGIKQLEQDYKNC